ncbi:MAG: hypothetical protein KAI66_05880, partial [Lentisphaeria bacterium]|nr:hypothetical protein [Lentisphaeria bacterium]
MSTFSIRICWLITSLMLAASYSQDMPPLDEIREKMRPDHPRLYFNRDTWSHVKSRAFGAEKDYYAKVRSAITSTPRKGWIQVPLPEPHKNSTVATADWGRNLMRAAFVYRAEPTPELLVKIKDMFRTSLAYYHAYYEAGQAVDWYGFSRICWLAAFDWVWDDLTAEERREFGVSMLEHMRQIMHKPGIVRRNGSGHTTGYYGANSCMWYAGVVFHQAGMDDTLANECLEYGYDRYSKLLAHRRLSCGDDGGAASVTVTYSYGAYPLAEWNFLHTLESATGFDIAANWPYIGMSCNYLDWNMLPGKLEYGYGDTPHLHNRFPTSRLYLHMSQTMHFYADSRPDLARLAKYTRDKVGGRFSTYDMSVFPFLLHRLDSVKKAMDMKGLPHARNFTNMGQI